MSERLGVDERVVEDERLDSGGRLGTERERIDGRQQRCRAEYGNRHGWRRLLTG